MEKRSTVFSDSHTAQVLNEKRTANETGGRIHFSQLTLFLLMSPLSFNHIPHSLSWTTKIRLQIHVCAPLPMKHLLVSNIFTVLAAALTFAAQDPAFKPAFAEPEVDLDASQIMRGAEVERLTQEALNALLLEPKGEGADRQRKAAVKGGESLQYLIVFKHTVELGTILGGSGELRIHKPGAPLPPNPANPSDWIVVGVEGNQSGPRFAPLAPGQRTQAVLVSDVTRQNTPAYLRFLKSRLMNNTPSATANADAEFTTEPSLSAPYTYDAGHITRGHGQWINSGKNGKGINPRAPITDVAPSWFVLSWQEKRSVEGLLLQDNFEGLDVQVFNGPDAINPVAATEQEWKSVRSFKQTLSGPHRWISFAPIQTRAVRILITKTKGPETSVAKLAGFHVLSDLGDRPVPAPVRVTGDEPVFQIAYELAQSGKVTMVVEDAEGKRVRNLIANVEQTAGSNTLPWDLKDEKGNYVAPGRYKWRGITHPPLALRYEMTAYPNVSSHFPERPAWLTGASGTGGWLADHTPPHAACVAGDRVFLGAPVAESGVSLIECDLEGRKQWGHASFAGFTGCWMLASDGRTIYNTMAATNFAKAGLDKRTEAVWAVDLESHKVSTVAMLEPTAARKRGLQGFAARDGKVYLAIHSEEDWFSNAAAALDVDLANCIPAYTPPRKERAPHEYVPDPRTDFLRLLRLKDTPPGQGSGGLVYLETTKSRDRQQRLMVSFGKSVPIGSLVFPLPPREEKVQFQISVLKPDAPYPPQPEERSHWRDITINDRASWGVVTLPEATSTRALLFSFIRGKAAAGEDLLLEVEEKKGGPTLEKTVEKAVSARASKGGFEGADDSWQRQLEGMKVLSRRFENVAAAAQVRVSSGKVESDGSWDARRSQPLSVADPAVYALEWKQPQTLRGLALKEIDGEQTEVDVFTGPAGAAVDIASAVGWETVATYHQNLRHYYQPDPLHNSRARYLDGYVDFGRDVNTRAVRLRIVKQWDTKAHYPSGVRFDQGEQLLDLKRCRVYGVAALRYLGGETPVDPLVTERIEVLDAASGKIVKEVVLPNCGTPGGKTARGNALAINAKGVVFALSNQKLVRVDMDDGNHHTLASDLLQPTTIACDATGLLYVFDAAKERKNIRIYAPDGKFLRTVGDPGGYEAGPWNPNRMDNVTALAVDPRGQVWAVDYNYWPKRVSVWSGEGAFLKEFLGPTQYGGAGCLDPGDKRRLLYGPLEFELDWNSGKTRLKNLLSLDGHDAADVPIRFNDRLYLVNTHPENNPNHGLVYLHDGNTAKLVAAVGIAGKCKPLLDPKLVKAFEGKVMMDYICAWSDLNGDGVAQPDEVQLWPKPKENLTVVFSRNLDAQIGPTSLRVSKFLPSGIPVYERRGPDGGWSGMTLKLDNGNFYNLESYGKDSPVSVLRPDGSILWTYQTEGRGGHALNRARPMHAGQIVANIGIAGHETAHAGDLGEFLVFNTNVGIWNIMTADGFFAAQLFRDIRDPQARPWSVAENTRGLRLDDFTPGQEHFNGHFTKTADNRYYAVVGHNHASVVEVVGMDKFKRFGGETTVSAKALVETQEWERSREKRQVYARAPVVDCYRLEQAPKIDGSLGDWPFISAEIDGNAKLRIGYDNQNLYLAYEISGRGPLQNKGEQWDRLFKTGASIDLQIGVDPGSAPDRRAPVAGDQRLLMTFNGDEPSMVLYQAVVPGTAPDKAWQVVSPVASAAFDKVVKLQKPRLATSGNAQRYVVEAAIPLATLGLKITKDLRLKMDWGVLASGPDGTEVLRREYWSNKATQIIADAPSEAILHPDLWGHVRFHTNVYGSHLDPTSGKKDKSAEDLLNELK